MHKFFYKYWFALILVCIFFVRSHSPCLEDSCGLLQNALETPFYMDLEASMHRIKRDFSISLGDRFSREERALIMGLVIGENELFYLPQFRDALRSTGTIHVVVVSGFNVGLVINVLVKVLNKHSKIGYISIIVSTLFYSVFTGFQAPIVRAWVMSFLVLTIARAGRSVPSLYVLVVSGLLMLALFPPYATSLSFQLSFLATLGIIYYDGFISYILGIKSNSVFAQDLTTTFAAQLFVWPLIAYSFGDVSILGLITNPLVLWLIPWATIIGFVYFLFYIFKISIVLDILAISLHILLNIFIKAIYFFESWSEINFYFKPTLTFMLIYFVLLFFLPKLLKFKKDAS